LRTVSDKGQEVRSELENGSELELRTAKDQKTSAELAQIEVKEDKLRSLCIDNSETKNENESKYITDSKFMNDSQSVSVTKEDHSIIGENELLSADRIKKNNDSSITNLSVPGTLMLSFTISSSRNKIPPSRNSDFLW